MAFFVKIIPPGKGARIHSGECDHCRNGEGQKNQDKGSGPTRWFPAYPNPGITLAEAEQHMTALNYRDVGHCYYCEQRGAFNA